MANKTLTKWGPTALHVWDVSLFQHTRKLDDVLLSNIPAQRGSKLTFAWINNIILLFPPYFFVSFIKKELKMSSTISLGSLMHKRYSVYFLITGHCVTHRCSHKLNIWLFVMLWMQFKDIATFFGTVISHLGRSWLRQTPFKTPCLYDRFIFRNFEFYILENSGR